MRWENLSSNMKGNYVEYQYMCRFVKLGQDTLDRFKILLNKCTEKKLEPEDIPVKYLTMSKIELECELMQLGVNINIYRGKND